MMLNANQHGQHVDDAALIRLRDGECDSSEERVLRAHLAACSSCKENAKTIDRLADGFLAAVGEIQHPEELHLPPRDAVSHKEQPLPKKTSQIWGKRRSLQIAALIALVVALSLTTAPARALVNSGWQILVELLSLKPEQQATTEPVRQLLRTPAQAVPSESVTEVVPPHNTRAAFFTPQGEVFLIALAHGQTGGTLSITVDTASRASVLVFGNADADELVVFRAGVRILNSEASSASYEFALPSGLRSVEVQIAGRSVVTLSPATLVGRAAWQLDLAGAGVR